MLCHIARCKLLKTFYAVFFSISIFLMQMNTSCVLFDANFVPSNTLIISTLCKSVIHVFCF